MFAHFGLLTSLVFAHFGLLLPELSSFIWFWPALLLGLSIVAGCDEAIINWLQWLQWGVTFSQVVWLIGNYQLAFQQPKTMQPRRCSSRSMPAFVQEPLIVCMLIHQLIFRPVPLACFNTTISSCSLLIIILM